jgi:hypothetical protein
VVEEKRVEGDKFVVVENLLLEVLCVCFFKRRKLEIKYAIEFSCDCSILSVYMLEGE